MAGIASPGIGSGLDVNKLVSQLVAADRAPTQTRLAKREAHVQGQITALGSLKSALSNFQDALASLKDKSAFQVRSAESGNTDLFTTSADSNAVAGSYSIEVDALAKAQKLSSQAYTDTDAVVGTGTLTITVNGETLNLDLDSSNNTLAGIRDAINNAADNPGVTATIVNANDGSHLQITSRKTGVANAAAVIASGDAGLTAFASGLTVTNAAADAQIKVDGYAYSGASNTITDVIKGVTLNLVKADESAATTLSVSLDKDAASKAVHAFVDSYNSFIGTVQSLSSYDADTKTAGPLLGDSTLLRIQSQIRQEIGGGIEAPAGGLSTLGEIGVTFQVDGMLAIDSDKLDTALDQHFDAVGGLFAADNGYAKTLDGLLESYLKPSGIFETRTDGLHRDLQDINDARHDLDERMQAETERYRAQFTALDTLVSSLRSTDSFLTRQFANLRGFYTNATGQ